jgi:hypothetical protein
MYPLLYNELESGRDGIEFVLSVLRAYEGQVHPLLQAAVEFLDPEDELLGIVEIVIDSSGVLVGEYGSVEAHEKRKAVVADWQSDERARVRDFAARYIRSAENSLAWERRRADTSVARRKIDWGNDSQRRSGSARRIVLRRTCMSLENPMCRQALSSW